MIDRSTKYLYTNVSVGKLPDFYCSQQFPIIL
jgi:hypothetical protein